MAGWVGLIALAVPGTVLAESRTALVVGNGAYQDAPLKNPANDARDVATKLRELGFQVIERLDADRQGLRLALREFEQQLRQRRGVGLFYYAGHGVQLKGQNYLIPIGVDIRQEFEVPDEGVDADAVLRAMESAGNELNIVILDACRNNPFSRGFGGGRGLARMEGPAGTFIAYATAPGAVSQDGSGRNSPYTRHLLEAMSVPGLNLEQVFKQVLVAVERESGGGQIPWVASSLRGEFYFAPAVVTPSPPATPPATPPAGPQPGTPPTGEFPPVVATPPMDNQPSDRPASAPLEPDWVAVPGAGFAISRSAVRLEAYRRFAEASGRTAPAPGAAPDGPARVTWREAMDYAVWLSAQVGHAYRLPAELEWEYAARAGVMVSTPDSDEQVREWTCSAYRREYEGQERRCASRLPDVVAIRGGNWRAGADPLSDDLEFRLVREP
ncbi:MAG: caspase family protein [Candidatus Competibacter sp.]